MERHVESWKSTVLDEKMEVAAYGHYGPAFLLFPFDGENYLGYEEHEVIATLAPFLDAGRIKVFTIGSVDRESWLADEIPARKKSIRHQQYNRYVTEEVVPFIARNMRSAHPVIYTCGVSLGALHAVNSFLRRPDLFEGTIGLSGRYDLKAWTNGYYDNDVYFNSPQDYLPNLTGPALNSLRQKEKIFLLSGKGAGEDSEASWGMGQLMGTKGIRNWVDLWGEEYSHDWPTWRAMLARVVESNF
jgi:esterase/lipase superfamily enzyme